jgi:hypothetical protein
MLIGKLIYLIVTRPDMSLVVSHISNFMYSPRTPHLDVVNKILRYLKGTPGKKIWMKKMTLMLYVIIPTQIGLPIRIWMKKITLRLELVAELSWIWRHESMSI